MAVRLKPDAGEVCWGVHQPHHLYAVNKKGANQRTTFAFDSCFS